MRILVLILLWSSVSWGQFEHQLVRRLVVFPLAVDKSFSDIGEEAWWQVREELAKNQRFLVATKRFLLRKDVFQSRQELTPADAILLGKILDAHALVVSEFSKKSLSMTVYDGRLGIILWKKSIQLQLAYTVKEQLIKASQILVRDFVASFPYQAFLVKDALSEKTVFRENRELFAMADLGTSKQIKPGDPVQWVHIFSNNNAPLFQGGAQMEVVAEGVVHSLQEGRAKLLIKKKAEGVELEEGGLVRFPLELKRLSEQLILDSQLKPNIDTSLVNAQQRLVEEEKDEDSVLVTTLSWLGSLIAILLLAF